MSAEARILIVEDDAGIALLERRALERAGHAVEVAATPEEAVGRLGRGGFDLAILDYQLGVPETGLDLYRRLHAGWPELPAILVTGFSDEGKVIEALRAGIRDVVPKVGDYLDYLPHAVDRVLKVVQSEEANRAKDQFLAVLSHELRTPLTPVLTTVQVLERRTDLPDEVREALAMIRRNVELEVHLIDDLLDLTGIARGKLELRREPVDLHEALREVLEICASDLEDKRIEVTADLAAGHPFVVADPARLRQVFWNVVKNAVKFTPEGGRIEIRTGEGPGGTVRVEVTDSGVGIEPDLLPRIFDAFEQGGRDVTRHFGGLGLGLAISKALVELQGGTITAGSDGRGRGATFTMILPAGLAVESARAAPAPPAAQSGQALGRAELRILLVEDHADTREALGDLLRIYGHDVEVAASVASALATVEGGRFDVVISDLGLPDGSGLDLMREIHARCSVAVKGICLSGFGMEEDLRQSREAGFLAHLTKPVDLRALEAVLSRVMQEPAARL